MKKIVFCDLDGTLVEKNQLIEPDIKAKIREFQKDNLFVINTGRNIDETALLIHEVKIPFDYMIFNNGAHIIDCNCQDLLKNVIDHQTGMAVLELILSYDNLEVAFYNGVKTYIFKDGQTHTLENGEFVVTHDDFYQIAKESGHFEIINCSQADRGLTTIYEVIERLQNYSVSCNLNDIYLDISYQGATKGYGAKILMEMLDFKGVSYGIGDSYNDLSMFAVVDHGATFHHCLEAIKAKADLLVGSVSELLEKVED